MNAIQCWQLTVVVVCTLRYLELRGRAAATSWVSTDRSSDAARSRLGVSAVRGNRAEEGESGAGDGRHGAAVSAVSIC